MEMSENKVKGGEQKMQTSTHCPYCDKKQAGQSKYVYRFIAIDGQTPYADRLKAVEIYCAECHHTIAIAPFM